MHITSLAHLISLACKIVSWHYPRWDQLPQYDTAVLKKHKTKFLRNQIGDQFNRIYGLCRGQLRKFLLLTSVAIKIKMAHSNVLFKVFGTITECDDDAADETVSRSGVMQLLTEAFSNGKARFNVWVFNVSLEKLSFVTKKYSSPKITAQVISFMK